jgi:Ca2+/H+ antiporter, TMEM165/GDT1 family
VGSLFAALGLVFVAELGDKTQLVALGFGARHRLGPVLAGVAVAYAACNLLSVAIGDLLGTALPTRAIGLGGGVLFLGFAAWTLSRSDEDEDGEVDVGDPAADVPADGGGTGVGRRSTALSVAASAGVAIFVAELGDKTMLATATLASQGHPVLVWIGATVGIIASGTLGVLLGRMFGARLPDRATRLGSAALFAGFGTVLVLTNL